jgi:hypothetical protein
MTAGDWRSFLELIQCIPAANILMLVIAMSFHHKGRYDIPVCNRITLTVSSFIVP